MWADLAAAVAFFCFRSSTIAITLCCSARLMCAPPPSSSSESEPPSDPPPALFAPFHQPRNSLKEISPSPSWGMEGRGAAGRVSHGLQLQSSWIIPHVAVSCKLEGELF